MPYQTSPTPYSLSTFSLKFCSLFHSPEHITIYNSALPSALLTPRHPMLASDHTCLLSPVHQPLLILLFSKLSYLFLLNDMT